MRTLAARRRHPAAIILLLLVGLLITGGAYAALAPKPAQAGLATANADDVQEGQRLFQANCATCHGMQAQGTAAGPSLVGVGVASVDFQVMTGRMPMAAPAIQVVRNNVQFSQEQSDQMGAYIATLGPGPGKPAAEYLDVNAPGVDIARGGNIYRVNCAMCHNFAGSGGALTEGKMAPTLMGVEPIHIYEAMLTGPQSMPVFSDANLSPEAKRDVIAFLKNYEEGHNQGGHNLGNLGPVGDGFFLWLLAMPLMVGAAVWLGRKAA